MQNGLFGLLTESIQVSCDLSVGRSDNQFLSASGFITSSIMSQSKITHLFNAYDLQADQYQADKINFQEVVDYCEARFRAALQAMTTITDECLHWMTVALFRELV
jgi:hypothetical protein